jgi:putative aldouronate transport system substrate-binding protein
MSKKKERKKMKKILALLLVAVLAFTIITACATSDDSPDSAPTPTPTNTPPPDTPPPTVEPNDPILEENGLEIVDGNFRFIETRKIVASFWDRAHDRQVMSESHWVEWVAEQMLEIHNIEVEWAQFRRWPDGEDMVTRIAANDPLDVAFDFGFDRIQPLADMGAIHDLTPLLAQYGSLLPNMYDLLGIDLIVRNRNPNPPHNMWAIANRQTADTRINTFVREDWLKALDIAPPTTLQEFEDMLFAFRDNAELLLGANAAQMIPYQPSSDLGWTADPVFTSFIPDDISEREWFIFGFDDRRFTMPGVKEGFRVLNNWYNEGLLFNDFALYDDQDPIFDDNLKLGFVGAFSGNWDFPFREDRGIIFGLKEEVGPDANFIVVTPFQNNAGNVVMHMPQATDRQIIIPATALDPLAALMYIDFMSRPTTIAYLSFGVEGINHTRSDDGIYQMIGADDIEDDAMIIVSVRNFDLNLMVGANGVFTGDPALDVRQRASALPGIPRAEVEAAINAQENHKRIMRNVNVGNIEAQGLYGSGLSSIRDEVLALSVTASVADFDSVWDAGMVNYLSSGGKQIIEERDAAWERTFGNVDHMPD